MMATCHIDKNINTVQNATALYWDEKYRSNLIRLITIINRLIGDKWEPYIQTPPFPQFTSGYSVTYNATAIIFTASLGKNFSFTDVTEIPFGNATNKFNLFY